VNLLKTAVA